MNLKVVKVLSGELVSFHRLLLKCDMCYNITQLGASSSSFALSCHSFKLWEIEKRVFGLSYSGPYLYYCLMQHLIQVQLRQNRCCVAEVGINLLRIQHCFCKDVYVTFCKASAHCAPYHMYVYGSKVSGLARLIETRTCSFCLACMYDT